MLAQSVRGDAVFVCFGGAELAGFEAHSRHEAALRSFIIDAIELLVLMREEPVGLEFGHFVRW
jgi:hypothetical protein